MIPSPEMVINTGHRVLSEASPSQRPSDAEVIEYATYLGMKLPEDTHLLWIARDGLQASLPKNWKPCQTSEGQVFYFNFESGESLWDHPLDAYYRDLYYKHRQVPVLPLRDTQRDDEIFELNETIADLILTLRASQAEVQILSEENRRLRNIARFPDPPVLVQPPLMPRGEPRPRSRFSAGNSLNAGLRKELKEIKTVLIQAIKANQSSSPSWVTRT